MIEFGKTLREAREAKGLSIAQLAEMTRMTSSRIEALEKEDFSHIPAAIYGRGFVRLYCEAVGLDPKPLAAEFTEIFSGNRDLEIKERAAAEPLAAASQEPVLPADAPSPAPVAETPAAIAETPASDFHLESREIHPAAQPEPAPAASADGRAGAPAPAAPEPIPEPPPPVANPLEKPPRNDRPLSRYAAPIDEQRPPRAGFSLPSISIPPAVWRISLLATVGLALLAALCFGVRALYRAVTGPGDANEPETALVAPAPAQTPAEEPKNEDSASEPGVLPPAPAAPREPQKIPPLYID